MLYLFDLDGTLVDSLEDLHDATEFALKELGYPGYPLDAYRYFVGNGVKKLLQRAFKTEDEGIYQKARALFDFYYEEHCLDHTMSFPGLSDVLQKMLNNGHVLGVVTNKPDKLAKKICQGLFYNTFAFVQGQVDQIEVKPNPYFVLKAMSDYHIQSTQCVFIGDSNVDILTGKNAGVHTIGVTWGFRTRDELHSAGAEVIVDSVEELAQALERMTAYDCM